MLVTEPKAFKVIIRGIHVEFSNAYGAPRPILVFSSRLTAPLSNGVSDFTSVFDGYEIDLSGPPEDISRAIVKRVIDGDSPGGETIQEDEVLLATDVGAGGIWSGDGRPMLAVHSGPVGPNVPLLAQDAAYRLTDPRERAIALVAVANLYLRAGGDGSARSAQRAFADALRATEELGAPDTSGRSEVLSTIRQLLDGYTGDRLPAADRLRSTAPLLQQFLRSTSRRRQIFPRRGHGPAAPQRPPSKWRWWHAPVLLIIAGLIAGLGLFAPPVYRLWTWLGVMVLLVAFTLVAGHGITGLWRGVLIDERRKLSLSRLQLVLWSVLVLAALLVAALGNIAMRQSDPLSMAVPAQLWALMGISTLSLVGAPLALSPKSTRSHHEGEMKATMAELARLGEDTKNLEPKGQLVVRMQPEDAAWVDLFRGDETGNAAQLDLGKVQLLWFTLVLVLAYGAALAAMFTAAAVNTATDAKMMFPPLDAGLVTLLGVSHAGYLTNKAIPHSLPAQATAPEGPAAALTASD